MEKAVKELDDHIKDTKRISQEINARSDKGLKAIEGVVGALRQKLHRIATDVARTRGVIDALKERSREVRGAACAGARLAARGSRSPLTCARVFYRTCKA